MRDTREEKRQREEGVGKRERDLVKTCELLDPHVPERLPLVFQLYSILFLLFEVKIASCNSPILLFNTLDQKGWNK